MLTTPSHMLDKMNAGGISMQNLFYFSYQELQIATEVEVGSKSNRPNRGEFIFIVKSKW